MEEVGRGVGKGENGRRSKGTLEERRAWRGDKWVGVRFQ